MACLHPFQQGSSTSPCSAVRVLTVTQFANWLELYADALEINVKTSTSAKAIRRNTDTQKWDVTLQGPDEVQRSVSVKHIVMAAGWPFKHTTFPGQVRRPRLNLPCRPHLTSVCQDGFEGQVIHSADFRSAAPYVGKKVLVIGACASGTVCFLPMLHLSDALHSSRCRLGLRGPRNWYHSLSRY